MSQTISLKEDAMPEDQSATQEQIPETTETPVVTRETYQPPELIEEGTVATLTGISGGPALDGGDQGAS
jgi:hypothetical protein